ncbi:hypothetical protein [Haladaptatus salinisoli]|uniref:hypothetical protein n=1 Tax=Haladaptatus salinisoli TaxID=2884876 RepID=UPI001D0B8130|nr:hypothetical protein [Haladaptatus salinisoli]
MLSGCASLGGNTEQTPDQTHTTSAATSTAAATTSADTATTTAATTTAATSTPTTTATTTTTGGTTTTATEAWSEPTPPNTPLQNKMESEERDRIESVSFVDKTEASGGGYSDFDLRITADTQMENIDPADHGDVVGEPYFLVYIGGSLDNGSRFSYTNGTLGARSNVSQEKSGEYTIDVHPKAFEKANVEDGEVEIMVLLMDRDSDWDDIYAVRTVTVEYSSGS